MRRFESVAALRQRELYRGTKLIRYTMATTKQQLGALGERLVCSRSNCPRCKRAKTLRRLPNNFKCADIICDFCGYLAQVKTSRSRILDVVPDTILGAAWNVQKERMDSGIYFPLFLVLVSSEDQYSCFYLSADLQSADIFSPRKPLSLRHAGVDGRVSSTFYGRGKMLLCACFEPVNTCF
jgi:type II restriction enzyme